MDPLIKTTLLRTLAFLILALLSPLLFVYVEYKEINDAEEKYKKLRLLYDSMASKCNTTIDEFNNFSQLAHEALSEPKPQWTYYHATDFVFQAFTTIGYGYITPQTPTGQILCIFVSLLGIPITLLTLNSIGELIAKLVNTIVTRLEKKIFKRSEPKIVKTKSAVALFSSMVVLVIVSGRIQMMFSGRTLVEEVYSWFITFSTIGFGDYLHHTFHSSRIKQIKLLSPNSSVNQENENEIHYETKSTFVILVGIAYICLYVVGLCIVSSVLNSIVAALEEHERRLRCSRCVPRKIQHHEDSEQHSSSQKCEADMTSSSMEDYGLQIENTESSKERRRQALDL